MANLILKKEINKECRIEKNIIGRVGLTIIGTYTKDN